MEKPEGSVHVGGVKLNQVVTGIKKEDIDLINQVLSSFTNNSTIIK